ncbi:MAG: hypothetical protein Q8940_07250 [Bacteroidota bacterium]|nr:hypothetical protein [Bacteroidota bacterium]
MIENRIKTIKGLLSETMADLALDAFKKGIRATLIPAEYNKHVDNLELQVNRGGKFEYYDIYANDLESFVKGAKFIEEHRIKLDPVIAELDKDPLNFGTSDDGFAVFAVPDDGPYPEEIELDRDSMY